MDLSGIQAIISQLNAGDYIWIAGAVVLAVIAIMVVAKILKFLLFAGAVLLLLGFLFSSGFLPI